MDSQQCNLLMSPGYIKSLNSHAIQTMKLDIIPVVNKEIDDNPDKIGKLFVWMINPDFMIFRFPFYLHIN